MKLLLAGQKGGTGKTTMVINTAAYLGVNGADVCVLDTDQQASSSQWVDRRNAAQSARARIHCVQRTGDVGQTVHDLGARYQHLVIDAGGRDPRHRDHGLEMRSALLAVDCFVTPVRPSQIDLWTIETIVQMIEAARNINTALRGSILLAIAPTNPRVNEADRARKVLTNEFGSVLPVMRSVICERKTYRDAAFAGLGVIEMNNAQAKAEVIQFVGEILDPATEAGTHQPEERA